MPSAMFLIKLHIRSKQISDHSNFQVSKTRERGQLVLSPCTSDSLPGL